MLIGSFKHGIDAKGRIFIPSKWREDLGATVVLTHGILGEGEIRCLFGMSQKAWEEFAAKFAGVSLGNKTIQHLRRILFSNANECELDKQGRILVPNGLRAHAALLEEAMLVGVDTRIELWSPANWEAYNSGMGDDYSAALLELAEQGI